MNATYEIQVIGAGRDEWMTGLREGVAAELLDVGLHRSVSVAVIDSSPTSEVPAVGVYFASPGVISAAVLNAVSEAIDSGLVVIPVVDDLGQFMAQVPERLSVMNGFAWRGQSPERDLARVLLAELGIEERQRRVFISHKRDDGLGAAEQLHGALTHRRFAPFIDRFAVREGQHVQDVIADALEDHAFLLVLETPLAHTSDWVFDEVDYALSHTMGILIVQWPGEPEPVPGSSSLPRKGLGQSDLITDSHGYEILTEAAMDEVIAAVEAAHARGLVRRRRMLIRSIEEAARASGAKSCVPLPEWRLLVEHQANSTFVGVTPRLPTAEDLQLLDKARKAVDHEAGALLVHSARALRPERSSHLSWVVGDRELELTPENAIGGRWK